LFFQNTIYSQQAQIVYMAEYLSFYPPFKRFTQDVPTQVTIRQTNTT